MATMGVGAAHERFGKKKHNTPDCDKADEYIINGSECWCGEDPPIE